MSTDNKPCPHCGSTDLVDGSWYVDDEEVDAVECEQCKAGAPASVWNDRAENDAAMNEASTLALAIHRRHYLKSAPNFELCDSLSGIISQIDNMTTGLLNENAALVKAARERDGGVHDSDCKINRTNNPVCNCGHDKLSALLQSEGEI